MFVVKPYGAVRHEEKEREEERERERNFGGNLCRMTAAGSWLGEDTNTRTLWVGHGNISLPHQPWSLLNHACVG